MKLAKSTVIFSIATTLASITGEANADLFSRSTNLRAHGKSSHGKKSETNDAETVPKKDTKQTTTSSPHRQHPRTAHKAKAAPATKKDKGFIAQKDKNVHVKTKTGTAGSMHSRIIGGTEVTNPDAYGYFAQWDVGCGASLIAPDILLSAAHCNLDPFRKTVWIGSHDYQEGDSRTIIARESHPDYDEQTTNNDYVVLKLNAPIVDVDPVVLAKDGDDPEDGDPLTVIGFGVTNDWGDIPETLQEVTVNLVPHEKCMEQYISGFMFINEETMLCAGVEEGGKDSCQGDSGGPLLDSFGRQVGVVSWGAGCADKDFPGIYSRVSSAYDWIQDKICRMSDFPPEDCDPAITNPPVPDRVIEGDVSLTLELTLDDFPSETAFSFSNADSENELVFYDYGSLADNSVVTETFNSLAAGTYKLVIGDDASDGICCGMWGNGDIKLINNANGDIIWSHNGVFGSMMEATLEIDASGNLLSSIVVPPESDVADTWSPDTWFPDTMSPTGDRSLTIEIAFDSYPSETTVYIRDANAWYSIGSIEGSVYQPNTQAVETFDSLPVGTYNIEIVDDASDGICCSHGSGTIKILDGETNAVLFESDGKFYGYLSVDIPLL